MATTMFKSYFSNQFTYPDNATTVFDSPDFFQPKQSNFTICKHKAINSAENSKDVFMIEQLLVPSSQKNDNQIDKGDLIRQMKKIFESK